MTGRHEQFREPFIFIGDDILWSGLLFFFPDLRFLVLLKNFSSVKSSSSNLELFSSSWPFRFSINSTLCHVFSNLPHSGKVLNLSQFWTKEPTCHHSPSVPWLLPCVSSDKRGDKFPVSKAHHVPLKIASNFCLWVQVMSSKSPRDFEAYLCFNETGLSACRPWF